MIHFSAHKALNSSQEKMHLNVSFKLEKGDILSIFGNSGAGKTTILRILAGLTNADDAEILVDGEIWNSSEKKITIPTQNRSIGFVFQDFALFPHLTVHQNLEFALPKNGKKNIISELLEITELEQFYKSKPDQLSGGQKQRVALARAIVRQPKLLLLDEPLSALDDEMRYKLQNYILKLHKNYNLTTLLVSHSIPEIVKLSNRVISLKNGNISLEGTPLEVFTNSLANNNFCLTGEIITLEQIGIECFAKVLVENKITQIKISENDKNNFQTGDKIILSPDLTTAQIRKLI